MPLTLNIGHSRKVGEPNFGSRGASVNLTMEVEASVVRDPEELRRKIKYLFGLAKESVDEELSKTPQQSNGRANGQSRADERPATSNQVRALLAISRRQRVNLSAEVSRRFDVDHPDRLSVAQASELIDLLKSTSKS